MDFDALYIRALKFLSFRPRSEKEMRDYLQKILKKRRDPSTSLRFAQDDNTGLEDAIVVKLKQQKFINDMEFAKMWVRSRTEYKPKGERLIRMELKQKGIGKELIDEAFEGYNTDQQRVGAEDRDETSLVIALLSRKRKKYEAMTPQERFRKAGSMLARRGFDLDSIKAAIDSVFGKVV